MSKASNLPVSDLPNRTKVPYWKYLSGITDDDPVAPMLEYLKSIGKETPDIEE